MINFALIFIKVYIDYRTWALKILKSLNWSSKSRNLRKSFILIHYIRFVMFSGDVFFFFCSGSGDVS